MPFSVLLLEILDYLGTVSFAISGAMTAIEARLDLFGVIVLGVITATGGGVFRDVLLGSLPPAAFISSSYVLLAAVTSLLLFLVVRRHQKAYLSNAGVVNTVNNVVDALGLGVFTISGIEVAVGAGYGDDFFFAVFLGTMTGVGGGLLRDILVGRVPALLTKRIYAVASILGGVSYLLLQHVGMEPFPAAAIAALLTFALRMLATHYRWNLPRAL